MNTSEIKRRVHVAGCPAGTFKSSVGNGNCTACPENSSAVSHDTTLVSAASAATCRCADGLVSHIVNGHLVRCSCKALFTVMTVMQPVAPPGGKWGKLPLYGWTSKNYVIMCVLSLSWNYALQ